MSCSKRRAVSVGVTAVMALALTRLPASAQSGCLKGTLLAPLGINGTVRVCPEYNARLPELQKQLDEIQKTLNGNQALMRELTHSARGVNALGRDVDANRQLELLRSWSKELQGWVAGGQEKTLQQISQLSDKVDALQDMITQSKEDEKTAQQTTTALNGRLGDAIAALDLANAQQQLESIQVKLNQIHEDTQDIRKKLDEQSAAAEQERKKAEALDQDPNMYTRAQIMPSRAPLNNQLRLMIFFYSRPPLYPPFIDSSFSIAFRKGTNEAWRVDVTDKQVSAGGELWRLNLDEVGDRATLCFVAHDRPSGRLKEWTQKYKITSSDTPPANLNFIPEGDAAMFLTDGEPCDGVKEVRKEAASAPLAASLPGVPARTSSQNDQLAQQTAMIQERMNALLAQSRGGMPRPQTFARITAQGSRRDGMNGNQWQIKVNTSPFRPGTTLYDEHVEANLVDASGRTTPLQLSNRQLFVNIESRYAFVKGLGSKAVVCMTAKDPARDKPYRLTQWFSIETSRVYWKDGGAAVPGDQATFVPAQPPTLTEASDAPCQ